MTAPAADEAQALIHLEVGRISNGVVEPAGAIQIPVAFFDSVQEAVLHQLSLARNKTLREYPAVAANSIADRLASSHVIARSDAARVRDLVELEIKRGIEHVTTDARDRFTARLPITLRSLIPLITRRSGKS